MLKGRALFDALDPKRVHGQWFGGDDAPEWEDYKPEAPVEQKWKYGTKTGSEYFGGGLYQNEDQNLWSAFGDPTQAATTYAGAPVVFGYTDENGVWHTTKNLYTEAKGLNELANQEVPGFEDWLSQQEGAGYTPDIQQTEPYQNVSQLLERMLSEEGRAQDTEAGRQFAAEGLGFGNTQELTGALQQERAAFDQALTSPAFDDNFYQTYWNAASAAMGELREENARLVEAISAEGRGGAYQARTQAIESLGNEVLKYQMGLMEREQLQRQAVFDSHLKVYNTYVEQGNAMASDYYDRLTRDRMEAIKGYATQLDTLLNQNDQYLQRYNNELTSIKLHADLTYQSIMASIGVDEAMMSKAQAQYNLNMQPFLDEWNMALDEYQVEWDKWAAEQEEKGFLDYMFAGALIIIGAVMTPILPPVGGALVTGGVTALIS